MTVLVAKDESTESGDETIEKKTLLFETYAKIKNNDEIHQKFYKLFILPNNSFQPKIEKWQPINSLDSILALFVLILNLFVTNYM